MVNLLLGNSNTDEIDLLYHDLANEKDFKIQTTTTGAETLSMYWKTNPDILVLDNSLHDITIEDLLNKLSSNRIEKKKCNTILTIADNSNDKQIRTVAKVDEIIYKPIIEHKLSDSIKSMAVDFNTVELEFLEIDSILQELNFNCLSPGYKLMKSAINYCYYNPNELETLNNILKHISFEQNIPMTRVRDTLNSSLRHFSNTAIVSKKINLESAFGNSLDNITLKTFLDRITLYLIREKKKGKIF